MSTYPGERCQHIRLNGDHCQAPAKRDQKFCRFHIACVPVKVDVSTSAAFPAAPFYLPVLEDPASIQLAISQVCYHLLYRRLDTKKAGIMLYAMQIASSNLGRLTGNTSQHQSPSGTDENNLENSREGDPQSPLSPPDVSTTSNDSDSQPDRLPPGTIQACAQPPRSRLKSSVV